MKTPLAPNEVLQKKSPANLQRGIETVGGVLYLTSTRLIFEPHALNIQANPEAIEIQQIESLRKDWTKFLDVIPVFPNTLAIRLGSGEEKKFVLFGRTKWITAINTARMAPNATQI